MEKLDDSKNLFEDIMIFEYVAGTLSPEAKANFEKALAEDSALQEAVATELAFRKSIEQSKPEAVVSADNIDSLFKLIDEDEQHGELNKNTPSSNVVKVNFTNRIAGSAIAACLLVAVFLSVNFNNQQNLLEPTFEGLSAPDQPENTDFRTLSSENRLIKFTLEAPLSTSAMESLLEEYKLTSLNQANSTAIVAQASQSLDEQALFALQADDRIKNIELVQFEKGKK